MIDQMKFKDELEEIREMVHDQLPRYLIIDKCNEKIAGYQKEIDEFEKWAEEESKKQENMAVPYEEEQEGGVEYCG